MTKDELIALAREAGMERVVELHEDGTRTVELPHPELLERFAALVEARARADEKAACIAACNAVDLVGADECIEAIRSRA